MTPVEIRLQNVMRRILAQESLTIRREMSAKDVDGWDSLTHIRLIIAIEKEFGFKIPTSELVRIKDVGSLIDIVNQRASVVA